MKFLCLHGAIASGKTFSIQLDPLERELSNGKAVSFSYIDAPHERPPPKGFETYFGVPPHYRWFADQGMAEQKMMSKLRQLPYGETPEDVLRTMRDTGDLAEYTAVDGWIDHEGTLGHLYRALEADPEIEGLIGYSEGACMAASLILDEMKRFREEGRPRQIKCATFLFGWPPLDPEEQVVLCDESSIRIDIPTLHVLGANDPYKCGAVALYNVCEQANGNATIFDTGKGHTIPRSGRVVEELGNAIRELVDYVHRD